MARAPYQVLVIPYCYSGSELMVAIFKRSDSCIWQFIAGGGEDSEDPFPAARREAHEEACISNGYWTSLDAKASIPRIHFPNNDHWDSTTFVIPEYAFAVEVRANRIMLSDEHDEFRWVSTSDATNLLAYDSNRVALWELEERLKKTNKSVEATG